MLASKKADANHFVPDNYERYAIYYIPDNCSELSHFGRSWFGYDPDAGNCKREYYGLDTSLVERITYKPARYGLHATLKAPFNLKLGYDVESLLSTLEGFAKNRKAFEIDSLKYGLHGGCLSLTVDEGEHKINQFASQCVLGFEDFRAPLSMKERTRRLEEKLSLHQRLMLEELGYPYVLSEFRFHITLSSRLSDQEYDSVIRALIPTLESICMKPLKINQVSLLGDPGNEKPFELIKSFPLSN